ncbi:hypothetical protein ACS0TY_032338 [Phlomoides rotata]
MASSIPPPHHHYSSDYFFSTEFCNLPICGSNMFNNNGPINDVVPSLNYDINSPANSFPDHQFGVAVVPQMSDIVTGFRDFSVSDQVFESPEDYCTGLLPNFCQNYNPMPPDNWGIQGRGVTKVEETEVKVGRYSVEERKDRILRYLKKRNHRNFNKTIKYACRKTLADKRVRVRGRFAKNEPSEEEVMMNTGHDHAYGQQNNSFNYKDSFQVRIFTIIKYLN